MNPVPWLQMTNMISYQGLVRTFLNNSLIIIRLVIIGCPLVIISYGINGTGLILCVTVKKLYDVCQKLWIK